MIVAASVIAALDGWSVVFVALVVVTGVLIGVGGGLVTIQLASRPLLRDVAQSLSVRPVPSDGVSVRVKLLAFVPALGVIGSLVGIVLGLAPGADLGATLPELLVTIAAITVFGGPIALLLAYSTLQPLSTIC